MVFASTNSKSLRVEMEGAEFKEDKEDAARSCWKRKHSRLESETIQLLHFTPTLQTINYRWFLLSPLKIAKN